MKKSFIEYWEEAEKEYVDYYGHKLHPNHQKRFAGSVYIRELWQDIEEHKNWDRLIKNLNSISIEEVTRSNDRDVNSTLYKSFSDDEKEVIVNKEGITLKNKKKQEEKKIMEKKDFHSYQLFFKKSTQEGIIKVNLKKDDNIIYFVVKDKSFFAELLRDLNEKNK